MALPSLFRLKLRLNEDFSAKYLFDQHSEYKPFCNSFAKLMVCIAKLDGVFIVTNNHSLSPHFPLVSQRIQYELFYLVADSQLNQHVCDTDGLAIETRCWTFNIPPLPMLNLLPLFSLITLLGILEVVALRNLYLYLLTTSIVMTNKLLARKWQLTQK